MEPFYRLELGGMSRSFGAQPASFWFLCSYLFFEYVRPQSIYPALEMLPWAQWSLIACTVAVVAEGRALRPVGRADLLILLFSVIVLASSFFAVNPARSFNELYVYLTWVLVYWLVTVTVDTEERFFLLVGLFMLFSLKMSQHASRTLAGRGFSYADWGAAGAPGWFRNSGEMAIQMTIFLSLSTYFVQGLRPYWKSMSKLKLIIVAIFPVSAMLAILASSSRGGQLAAVAVLLWMVLKSRRKVRGLLIGVAFGLAAFALIPSKQMDRFSEMGTDKTSEMRFDLWEFGIETANEYPLLGIGYDNWATYTGSVRPDLFLQPHNIFVEAGAELGYTGLLAFLALIGGTFWMNRRTRALARQRGPQGRFLYYMGHGLDAALIGYLVSGFFVTVLFYPFFWINFAMAASALRTAEAKLRRQQPLRAPARPPPRSVSRPWLPRHQEVASGP